MKRKERKRNAHCDSMKITIFLLYSSDICLLYCCAMVYVCNYFFVFYLYCTLIYICCYNQYSLMRYCTILSILCARLVYTMLSYGEWNPTTMLYVLLSMNMMSTSYELRMWVERFHVIKISMKACKYHTLIDHCWSLIATLKIL